MRKELKTYNSIGNKAGIILLCKKVLHPDHTDIPSVKALCSFIDDVELNFNCGLIALEELQLIKIRGNKLHALDLLYSDSNENEFITKLCRHCFNILINKEQIDINLLFYNEKADIYQMPKRAFKLDSAVFRNLLITLGALSIDNSFLSLNKEYEDIFTETVFNKRKLPQEQLLKKLEKEREMGEAGEKFVLNYERQRCPFNSIQKQKIKQISIIDASAGYDIISFHSELTLKKRYIEVKTYLGKPHFYWSENEIQSAKLRGEDYYVYLVDYACINTKGYEPEIIANPILNIMNQEEWIITPSTFYIEKKNVQHRKTMPSL